MAVCDFGTGIAHKVRKYDALDYEFPDTVLYFEISINDLPEDEDYYPQIHQ